MKRWFVFFAAAVMVASASSVSAINIKDVTITIPNFGKVVFGHNDHFKQEGIKDNCKTCHNAIFNLRAKQRFTMADMEKGKSCGACHNEKRAFGLKECASCHKAGNVSIPVKETGPVIFGHKKHVKDNNCSLCHPKLYDLSPKRRPVTMAQMEKGKSCGACHNGKAAFKTEECAKCHPTKEILFKVKDAGDAKFSHDLHGGMYKCDECHPKLYLPAAKNKRFTMADMEGGRSCGACHDDKAAFTVKENCDRCHKM